MEETKTKGQELAEELFWSAPHIAKKAPAQIEEADRFCEGYKKFLDRGKTERECVRYAVELLEENGYRPFDEKGSYGPGDKVYTVNRGKALIATTFGTESLEKGVRINGAHIDSPRLDLKPAPVYEKDELSYLKTHYYGGLRKYQWGATPLAIHGVAVRKDGTTVEICIGEKEGDPVFCITDLLPHLAGKQSERPLKEGLRGEELNLVIGSVPYQDEEVKEPFKLLALQLLHEQYQITEKDFFRAEIEIVPAVKAVDVGLDRSMIGAYGQDDRVCAYTGLMAEIETVKPAHTTVTILTDKEEIGSAGDTGLDSDYLLHYIEDLAAMEGVPVRKVLRASVCLSSDVNAAFDPTFPDVFEKRNACQINHGCVLTKYTGARGKSSSNDARAELMAQVIQIMEEEGVYWQAGEMGKVDEGGGGTIARFVARMDIETVDLGVPILSMHAPFELASKLDVLSAYKAFKVFYR